MVKELPANVPWLSFILFMGKNNSGKNVETSFFTAREVTTSDAVRIENLVANAFNEVGKVGKRKGAFTLTVGEPNPTTFVLPMEYLTGAQIALLEGILEAQVEPKS